MACEMLWDPVTAHLHQLLPPPPTHYCVSSTKPGSFLPQDIYTPHSSAWSTPLRPWMSVWLTLITLSWAQIPPTPHKPWIHLITLFNFSVAAFHVLDASYLCICLGVQSLFLLTELYEVRDLGLPVHSLPRVIPAHSRSCINTWRKNEREAGTGVWLVSVQSLGS